MSSPRHRLQQVTSAEALQSYPQEAALPAAAAGILWQEQNYAVLEAQQAVAPAQAAVSASGSGTRHSKRQVRRTEAAA